MNWKCLFNGHRWSEWRDAKDGQYRICLDCWEFQGSASLPNSTDTATKEIK